MTMPATKRIVITGVSRGLGQALVDGFIARGHIVFGCARSAEAIADLRCQYPAPNRFAAVDVTRDNMLRVRSRKGDESPACKPLLELQADSWLGR